MLALTMFEDAQQAKKPLNFEAILNKTKVIRSSVYKLRLKAISRGQEPSILVKPKHVNNALCLKRLKTSIATTLFIIKTIT